MVEVEEVFDLYFYRPLAFFFVKAIYRTSITPNQLTVVSMIIGVIGGALYGAGTAGATLLAGVLIILYDVLDCSDGQLARLKQNGTRIGRILDGFADYIVNIVIYLGIGIGFASHADYPVAWWLLTIAAGISNTVHAMFVDFYRNRFLDVVLERVNLFDEDLESFRREYEELKASKGSLFERVVIWMYLRYSSLQQRLTKMANGRGAAIRYRPEEYYRRNRRVLRMWLLLGPTSQITFLVVCSLVNRLDIYVLGLVVAGNLWAALLFYLQHRVNARLTPVKES
jgi:hypothetical protein